VAAVRTPRKIVNKILKPFLYLNLKKYFFNIIREFKMVLTRIHKFVLETSIKNKGIFTSLDVTYDLRMLTKYTEININAF